MTNQTLTISGSTDTGYFVIDADTGKGVSDRLHADSDAAYAEADELSNECRCGDPLNLHIGGKPCVYGEHPTAKNLRDLPIYKWASSELDR